MTGVDVSDPSSGQSAAQAAGAGSTAAAAESAAASSSALAAASLERVRASVPLVQCITNTVVQQFSANVLLAAGASPAMLDHEADAAQFAALAGGVLVNFGTATSHQLLAADAAVRTANALGTPWVLDPVSLGAADHRSMHIRRLADSGPTAIRGNASEIAGLAGTGAGGRGIESIDTVDDVLAPAAELAARTGAVIAVSGPVDAVVAVQDGEALIARIAGGHRLMPLVVGTGCSLGALTAAYLGAVTEETAAEELAAKEAAAEAQAADRGESASGAGGFEGETPAGAGTGVAGLLRARFHAVVAAHAHFAAAGAAAGARAGGPGTFQTEFLDALHAVSAEDIAGADIRLRRTPLSEVREAGSGSPAPLGSHTPLPQAPLSQNRAPSA
ncbi:hydroxyethylthiazole kinase [Brevibacterium album]|uniref:hydroxyethylthiazole kinase n=1 Tax=Brevibacterium album TaxID=417948 RepID=UPI0003FE2DDF|nr:hydroxyethylthiazole kinase [Brevibacterium album]